jgi:hypothetical protein
MARLTGGRFGARSPVPGRQESDGQPLSPTIVTSLLERTPGSSSATGGQIELPVSPPAEHSNGYFARGRPVEDGVDTAERAESSRQSQEDAGVGGSVNGPEERGRRESELDSRLGRLRAAIASHQTGASGAGGRELPSRRSLPNGAWGTITGLPDRAATAGESSTADRAEETSKGHIQKGSNAEDLV